MKYIPLFLLLLLIVSCSSPIGSFEGEIENTKSDMVQVNCSSTVNREKTGDIENIGYICNVDVTKDTVITNMKGKQINIDDLKKGQKVQIVLNEKVDISESKNSREVTADEINVLTKGDKSKIRRHKIGRLVSFKEMHHSIWNIRLVL